jgi:hypothetical protein
MAINFIVELILINKLVHKLEMTVASLKEQIQLEIVIVIRKEEAQLLIIF